MVLREAQNHKNNKEIFPYFEMLSDKLTCKKADSNYNHLHDPQLLDHDQQFGISKNASKNKEKICSYYNDCIKKRD